MYRHLNRIPNRNSVVDNRERVQVFLRSHTRILALLMAGWLLSVPPAGMKSAVKQHSKLDQLNPREFYLKQMVKGVPDVLSSFLENSGRFSRDGWSVDNQEVIYPLAFLYTLSDPANPFSSDSRLLHAVQLGGDAICDSQYEDGTVEMLRPDGSNWGRTYLHETLNAWMETYELLKDKLGAERRQRWEKGIMLQVEGIQQLIQGTHNPRLTSGIFRKEEVPWEVGNFDVNLYSAWNGVNLYRAGQIFGRESWKEIGQKMVYAALESLDPLGFWPEYGGPSPTRNLQSFQALSLYYEYSGDLAAVPYLERASVFLAKFVYPNGSLVETLDGCSRFVPGVQPTAHFGFSQFPEGRRFARYLVGQASSSEGGWALSSRLVRDFRYYHEGKEEGILQEKKSYVDSGGNKVLVRRKTPWMYCLSAFTAVPAKTRWALDRQNFVSVWHDQAGLIITGGSSKRQPDWSNFVFSRAGRPLYLPSAGEVKIKGSQDQLFLDYEGKRASLELEASSKKELRLRAQIEAADQPVTGHLILNLRQGSTVKSSSGALFSLTDKPIEIMAEGSESWIESDGWRLTLPAGSHVSFPSFPYYPEDRQLRTPLDEARASLTYSLNPSSPGVTITIRILRP